MKEIIMKISCSEEQFKRANDKPLWELNKGWRECVEEGEQPMLFSVEETNTK